MTFSDQVTHTVILSRRKRRGMYPERNQASIDLRADRIEQALKRLQEAIRLYRQIGSPEADKLERFLSSPNTDRLHV